MELAVRSYLASGVAVAAIGAVAVSPVAPPMPDLKLPAVQTSAVELSALVNPFDEFGAVFAQALENVSALGGRVAENPAPILSQIVKNQLTSAAAIGTFLQTFGSGLSEGFAQTPAQLQEALQQLAAGQITDGLNGVQNALLGPVVGAVVGILFAQPEVWTNLQNAFRQPIANALAVVDMLNLNNVGNLLGPLLGPIQLLSDVTNAVGGAGDNIVAGLKTGNAEQVANAILSFGPNLAQAVVNGNKLAGDFAAGLLGPNGIVAGLLTIRDLVAQAITPKATLALAEANVTKVTAANTVTLDVAPAIEAPKAKLSTADAGVKDAGVKDTGAKDAESATATTPASGTATDAPSSTVTETTAPDTGTTTKDSPKAVPGKTGTSTTKANRLKDVSDGIRGALKDVGKGLKDAASGLGGKSTKAGAADGSAKAGSSAKSGGSSSGGSGNSGGGSE
ncbi:hypothetical protein [Mycolicibacterium brisbanense]|uniref:PE-PGRS family protein n=1 Tax=Mycolicibacterium brisbanense TaxID=146020 RepID=A0A100VZS3_9MYCO|nr:hypothetical protein [Mycolicibacterium brisbanense]MCV7156172.1 hypothetical protein [Mycolicibacterium brisbanense]GAS88931.1 uncharacterized protein RMCB_3027 [Mycolicibacterium brisbanense]